jgi:hypothetical protein
MGLVFVFGSTTTMGIKLHFQTYLRNGLNYDLHGEFYTSIEGAVGSRVLPFNGTAAVKLDVAIGKAQVD